MKPIDHILAESRVSIIETRYQSAAFKYRSRAGSELRCIISIGGGWDHLSVHAYEGMKQRCPTWDEMEEAKRLCFKPDETAMQLHVSEDDHINLHPHVLHVWRPQRMIIPVPPTVFV